MYQALYRKYRPIDFDSVVGQNAIVKTLKNSIINNNFSHAYMFFGPRGTGKTTVSKIFARNINCLDSKDGNACGKCSACTVSFAKECIDIIEIDAASNNGVDEIRELKNKINLVPSELKYKVYIIDEVHMLSIGAFNALLKTLEEPPEHAIFILATTDPQKVPETIISRCQTFSFKRISNSVIVDKINFVCKSEKIKIDSDVIDNIALFANGGLRDALVLLDKLVSYSNNQKITMDDFIEVNSIISLDKLKQLLFNIMSNNIANVIKDIDEFDVCGKNFVQITIQLLDYLRNIIVNYYVKNEKVDYSIDLLLKLTNYINECMFDIKKSDNTKIFVEMILLKFMSTNLSENSDVIDDIDNKSEINEKKVGNKVILETKTESLKDIGYKMKDNSKKTKSVSKNDKRIVNLKEIMDVRINNAFATADKGLLKKELQIFDGLKDYAFDQEIGYIVCNLLDSNIRVVGPENIIISYEYQSTVDKILLEITKLNDVYNKLTNSNKKIAVITDDDWLKLKSEYIEKMNNKEVYKLQDEPDIILEDLNNNDIISGNAVELFGNDIVEIN